MDFLRLNDQAFEECPSLSIDKAVMEKTTLGTVIPLNAGWNDIGSWQSLWQTSTKDQNGNVIKGKVILEDGVEYDTDASGTIVSNEREPLHGFRRLNR